MYFGPRPSERQRCNVFGLMPQRFPSSISVIVTFSIVVSVVVEETHSGVVRRRQSTTNDQIGSGATFALPACEGPGVSAWISGKSLLAQSRRAGLINSAKWHTR